MTILRNCTECCGLCMAVCLYWLFRKFAQDCFPHIFHTANTWVFWNISQNVVLSILHTADTDYSENFHRILRQIYVSVCTPDHDNSVNLHRILRSLYCVQQTMIVQQICTKRCAQNIAYNIHWLCWEIAQSTAPTLLHTANSDYSENSHRMLRPLYCILRTLINPGPDVQN